jgi:prepilin-type N-terminal cleavage/methylation domain-containing protein
MKDLIKKTNRGFTIIEVMIVLAIAGLIMVIVFIAVPQLQRNQRDNARQSIANRVKAELETYAGNNQGAYPFQTGCATTGCWNDFVDRYITGKVNVTDPTLAADVIQRGNNGQLGAPRAEGASPCGDSQKGITHGEVHLCYQAKCDGENIQVSPTGFSGTASTTTRVYALVIGLDRDGTDYCVDNG